MSEISWVDPETHAPVARADEEALATLRKAIAEGRAKRADGGEIPAFEGAYLTSDGTRAYLIVEGIPNFLLEERIELMKAAQ
ncbi:MAG: hypothetical protein AAGE52_20150 [Myxococcota bacterium]